MTFQDFQFDQRIQKSIDKAGFESPMPVQEETFKLLLRDKRDVYVKSQTGTGKTAAFILSIYQLKLTEKEWEDKKALVVVPTRELSIQIEQEAKLLGSYLDFVIGAVYGGVGYKSQEALLAQGVDFLIGTPGRLIDFSQKGLLDFQEFGFLVIDEADRLFDMGFFPDLKKILNKMRPYNERRTMLFSATLSSRVGNLAWEYMNNPGDVIIDPEKVTVDTVVQELYHVGKEEKFALLLGILKKEKPQSAIIFTNTRHMAWEVAKRLEKNGLKVECLMGDLPQSQRSRIVERIKQKELHFMVATDVAARGLHINELHYVINYDVPLEAESYVHRIGRTARAGKSGKTITLACEEYVYGLLPIEKFLKRKIPVKWADESLKVTDKSAGMNFPPQDRYREIGKSFSEKRDYRDSGRQRSDRSSRSSERYPKRNGRSSPSLEHRKPQISTRSAKIQAVISKVVSEEYPSRTPSFQKKETPRYPRSSRNRSQKTESYSKTSSQRLTASSSLDDRLDYYKKKYGENFRSSNASSGKTSESLYKLSPSDKKPQPSSTSRKVNSQRRTAPAAPKPKKRGFLSWLLGKKP